MTKTSKPNVLPARRFELVEGQIVTHYHGRTAVLADVAPFPPASSNDPAERARLMGELEERVRLLQELIRRANAYHDRYIPTGIYDKLIGLSSKASDPQFDAGARIEAEQEFRAIATHYISAPQLDDLTINCANATPSKALKLWCRALGLPTEQVREVAP